MSKAIDNISTQDAKDVYNYIINPNQTQRQRRKLSDLEYRTTARNHLRYHHISMKVAKATIVKAKLLANAL